MFYVQLVAFSAGADSETAADGKGVSTEGNGDNEGRMEDRGWKNSSNFFYGVSFKFCILTSAL
jgi:hypothetical protein